MTNYHEHSSLKRQPFIISDEAASRLDGSADLAYAWPMSARFNIKTAGGLGADHSRTASVCGFSSFRKQLGLVLITTVQFLGSKWNHAGLRQRF